MTNYEYFRELSQIANFQGEAITDWREKEKFISFRLSISMGNLGKTVISINCGINFEQFILSFDNKKIKKFIFII